MNVKLAVKINVSFLVQSDEGGDNFPLSLFRSDKKHAVNKKSQFDLSWRIAALWSCGPHQITKRLAM